MSFRRPQVHEYDLPSCDYLLIHLPGILQIFTVCVGKEACLHVCALVIEMSEKIRGEMKNTRNLLILGNTLCITVSWSLNIAGDVPCVPCGVDAF